MNDIIRTQVSYELTIRLEELVRVLRGTGLEHLAKCIFDVPVDDMDRCLTYLKDIRNIVAASDGCWHWTSRSQIKECEAIMEKAFMAESHSNNLYTKIQASLLYNLLQGTTEHFSLQQLKEIFDMWINELKTARITNAENPYDY